MTSMLVMILLLSLVGCVTANVDQPVEMQVEVNPVRSVRFGQTVVKRHADVFISSRPDKDAFKAAASAGVGLIINLQEKNESKETDMTLARQAGVPYLNIPVNNRGSFKKDAFEEISAAVANATGPVWVYCASGNRASAWYAAHLMLKHGMDQDQALKVAHDLGMSRPELQDRILDYVNSQK